MTARAYRGPTLSRLAGVAVVVALHVGVAYALVTGLAQRTVEVVRAPVETRILVEDRQEPPAPPPPNLAPPPPIFIPPPEVRIPPPPAPPPPPTPLPTLPPPHP